MAHTRPSKLETVRPRQKLSPSTAFYALGLALEGSDQKTARRVYGCTAKQARSCAELLTEAGVLTREADLTDMGLEWLQTALNLDLLRTLPPLSAYRVTAGSLILGQEIHSTSVKVLGDVGAVSALLLLPSLPENLPKSRGGVFEIVGRTVAADFVKGRIRGFRGSPPSVTGRIDPLVMDLFEASTGHRSLERGIAHMQSAAGLPVTLNTPRTVDSRWRTLTKARFDTMVTPRKRQGDNKLSMRIASEASRVISPNWTLIYNAFQAYREIERVSLEDFKAALGTLFADGLIELRAIDVPRLFPDKESGLSATDLGGMTFQLVRLRG